jgi:hypothetical protein
MSVRFIRFSVAVMVCTTAAPAALGQGPIVVSFNGANGANDLNQFVVNVDGNLLPTTGAGSVFNWDAAAGVNDNGGNPGGGLLTNTTDATAAFAGAGGTANPTVWNLGAGATVTTMLKVAALPTNRFIQIGFMNQLSNSLNNNAAQAPTAFVSVRLYQNSRLEFQTKSVGAGTTNADFVGAGADLTLNNWYRVSLTVQETSPTNFSATVRLDDFGASGTALVSNLFTGTRTATVTGFEVSNGNTLGADMRGIAAMRQVDGAANFDNFTVTAVPEPVAPLAVAACAAAGLFVRRRRQRGA